MTPLYQTRRYSVHLGDGVFRIEDLYGKTVNTRLSFQGACELADLYQGDDDAEYEREAWEAERGLKP